MLYCMWGLVLCRSVTCTEQCDYRINTATGTCEKYWFPWWWPQRHYVVYVYLQNVKSGSILKLYHLTGWNTIQLNCDSSIKTNYKSKVTSRGHQSPNRLQLTPTFQRIQCITSKAVHVCLFFLFLPSSLLIFFTRLLVRQTFVLNFDIIVSDEPFLGNVVAGNNDGDNGWKANYARDQVKRNLPVVDHADLSIHYYSVWHYWGYTV